MAYMHLNNLYRSQDILLFRHCYALEKIHGTSAHIRWQNNQLTFFGGCVKYDTFVGLFDKDKLKEHFIESGVQSGIIYGEAYGSLQGMSDTYGKNIKFIAFDVNLNDCWLSVPHADKFVRGFGLEFVAYKKISTDIGSINEARDAFSVQAGRNGILTPRKMEGIVLRPLIEVKTNNGERIIAKHKRDDFQETKTPRSLDPEKLKVLEDAQAISDEWVTSGRLKNASSHFPEHLWKIDNLGNIIDYVIKDVAREAKGEIIDSREVRGALGKATAKLFKEIYCDLTNL